jgi:hypothetical protein
VQWNSTQAKKELAQQEAILRAQGRLLTSGRLFSQTCVSGEFIHEGRKCEIKLNRGKEAGKPAFQLDGTADSNATIASLVKALEGASETTKVYLVSTEKKEEDGRQVFVLTADYAAK